MRMGTPTRQGWVAQSSDAVQPASQTVALTLARADRVLKVGHCCLLRQAHEVGTAMECVDKELQLGAWTSWGWVRRG